MRSYLPMFALALVASTYLACSDEPAVEEVAAPQENVVPMPQAWELGDRLMANRQTVFDTLAMANYPYADRYTPEALQQYAVRRTSAIDWAATHLPHIVYVEYLQSGPTDVRTPEFKESIARSQAYAFDTLTALASGAQVILVQSYGTDERLTVDALATTVRTLFTDMEKRFPDAPQPTDEEIVEMVNTSDDVSFRAVRTLQSPPIYNGEEWPLALQFFLLDSLSHLTPEQQTAANTFATDFTALRAEVVMIRAIEYLRAVDGTEAIIVASPEIGDTLPSLVDTYYATAEYKRPAVADAQEHD